MTSMKYTVNGAQTTDSNFGSSVVTSNGMKVVAAYPTITKAADTPVGMSSGYLAGAASDLLHFTVTNGSTSNPINLDTITVTPTYSGTLTSTTSPSSINIYNSKDLNTVIATSTLGVSGEKISITFTADEVINSSETYVVKADTSGLTSDGNSIRMSLTSADTILGLDTTGTGDWSWNDSTVSTYANGYLVKNLPVDGNTMVK